MLIETHTLSKVYRTRGRTIEALKDVSVRFPAGVTALIGSNGSGKSTLMRILCTIESASRGSFRLNGNVIEGKARALYRLRIGYVPQDVRFVSTMSCKDVLAYAGWVAGLDRKRYLTRIPEVLELVDLPDAVNARIGSLSGGQNRRIGIAAALMHEPEILFLDEPTAGLDPQARIEVRKILNQVASTATVVFSTHLADDVATLAQRVIAMNAGRAAYEGSWNELVEAAMQSQDADLTHDDLELALTHVANTSADKGSAS
ncbi:ABC transporter ATP-binding protein [Corynebacterium liangguodongii]|uniref:ABC transporter ATP-binding protein n=1 Tax=Corynebacterium liangguodongii TaxID=2079535 RepID=A0A2S0WE53_9CORY|nr:ATP-binding cassette domain-containing protein [Corynebacterium liangguodongii]AWB84004.1 ABC transporter ATP-binding protein [Corynebacterium liangguodongii]PWC00016.1 ABC transporter ATP-binding protein [Corynebacterium liangguodongii]